MRQGTFLPESTFSADSFTCVRTPPCAIACINICAHVEDQIVHVRVRWVMETLKHPECTVGWVARLCRSWLFLGKATRISHGDNTVVKSFVLSMCVCACVCACVFVCVYVCVCVCVCARTRAPVSRSVHENVGYMHLGSIPI